jgi:hypothetical protein
VSSSGGGLPPQPQSQQPQKHPHPVPEEGNTPIGSNSLFTFKMPRAKRLRPLFGDVTLTFSFIVIIYGRDIYICMKGFKRFVNEDEDVQKTIAKLPRHHQILVKGYKFQFEPGNTLKGDDGHVGMIVNKPEKIIRIAAPWRFGREFTLLHEIAHLVYEFYVRGTPLEVEWGRIEKSTPNKKENESAEENFCHAYANVYASMKITIHTHPEWKEFILRLPKTMPKR